YIPQANYYGPDSFIYQVSDGVATSQATAAIDVYQQSVSAPGLPAGGSASTDPLNLGATTTVPIQASVTLPATISGDVSISTGQLQPNDTPPIGYSFLNYEVDITAPVAVPPASPLIFVFRLDGS